MSQHRAERRPEEQDVPVKIKLLSKPNYFLKMWTRRETTNEKTALLFPSGRKWLKKRKATWQRRAIIKERASLIFETAAPWRKGATFYSISYHNFQFAIRFLWPQAEEGVNAIYLLSCVCHDIVLTVAFSCHVMFQAFPLFIITCLYHVLILYLS